MIQYRLAFVAFSLLLCIDCCTQAHAAELTAEDRAADIRLESPVTLSESRICIGALLEKIAKQTGVAVRSDEKDAGSGIEVAVNWTRVPLCDALNSLWALVSYRQALWAWYWEGKPSQRKYMFVRTPAARQLASQLDRLLHDSYLYQADTLLAATKLSQEERDRLAAQDKDGLLKPMLEDKRMMSGLGVFVDSVPADKQLQIIEGTANIVVPFEQLSEHSKEYVRSEYRLSGSTDPDPTRISFKTRIDQSGIPVMYMMMGSIGGYGYLGGAPLQQAMHSKIGTLWYLPGDSYTHPLTKAKISKPATKEGQAVPGHVIEARLEQLARLTPLNLTARMPPVDEYSKQDAGVPMGYTVASYLDRLEEFYPRMQRKWRKNILLLTYPGWYQEGDPESWAKQKSR